MSFYLVKIKDVCSFIRGLTYSKSDEVEFSSNAVLRANNIDLETSKLNLDDIRYINDSVKISSEKKVKVNDILICTASGSKSHLGKVALIENHHDMAFGGFMGVLRSRENILPQYLFYFLKSDLFGSHIRSLSDGANINNLKFSQIENLEIPLPSLATQQKIVATLDAIFAEIDKAVFATEANVKNAKSLFESYLTEIFQCIAEDIPVFKFSQILKLEYGKALPDSDRNINGLYEAYGANGAKTRTNKFLYSEPSIVVGRKGSAGELTLVREKFWALDVTYYVTHDKNQTDLNYLYYALKTKNLTSLARGVKPGINRNDVYELEIPLPSLATQKKIVFKLDALSETLIKTSYSFRNKLIKLLELKKSILKQAFNGELVKD